MTNEALERVGKRTLDCAFSVHTELGPGLLESSYKACLFYELKKQGLASEIEVPVPVYYDGTKLVDVGYRIDILVCGELILEIKSLEAIAHVHKAQLVSYLKLAKKRLGFLLNFNVPHLRDGITRRVNEL